MKELKESFISLKSENSEVKDQLNVSIPKIEQYDKTLQEFQTIRDKFQFSENERVHNKRRLEQAEEEKINLKKDVK